MPQVSLDQLVAGVFSGKGLISFPTDTVPAIATHPDRAGLIFAVKQRSSEKPLILMGATLADLWGYVAGCAAERQVWQRVADRYWPGALTLVLPASDRVPPALNPKHPGSIGVRVPNHAIARGILSRTGALATTSANRSGQPPLNTSAEIEAQFPEILTLSPDELTALHHQSVAPLPSEVDPDPAISPVSGVPSTVARWTGSGWEILRQGAVVLPQG